VKSSLEIGIWWRDKEAQLPVGAVVVPKIQKLILYSDETEAMNFGSRKFNPVYATIGNIPQSQRRSLEAYVLLGYIPILEGTKKQKGRWRAKNLKGQILHYCLDLLLQSLVKISEKYPIFIVILLISPFISSLFSKPHNESINQSINE